MENVTIKINGVETSVPAGTTILEAAHMANIEIPTLCFMKEINAIGACRICMVEAIVWLLHVYTRSAPICRFSQTPPVYWKHGSVPWS